LDGLQAKHSIETNAIVKNLHAFKLDGDK